MKPFQPSKTGSNQTASPSGAAAGMGYVAQLMKNCFKQPLIDTKVGREVVGGWVSGWVGCTLCPCCFCVRLHSFALLYGSFSRLLAVQLRAAAAAKKNDDVALAVLLGSGIKVEQKVASEETLVAAIA